MLRRLLTAASALACAVASSAPAPASAGGLELDVIGARAIGRAGAVTVSEDGGAALLVNPGGLARRGGTRLRLGVAIHDDDRTFRAADADTTRSPTIRDKASPVATPTISIHGSLGPFIVGAAYVETGDARRELPIPQGDQPPAEVSQFFPHRYGGVQFQFRRRTLVAGAALRPTDWLGLGVAVTGSQVNLRESRYIWAGFKDRLSDQPIGNPLRDLRISVAGTDNFVPGAAVGLLVAPPQLPLELAASASWSLDADVEGDAALVQPSSQEFPRPATADPVGRTELASPLTVRAGMRYMGDRFFLEIGGDLVLYPGDGTTPTWDLAGVALEDQTAPRAVLVGMESVVDQRDHAAIRAAVDVEVVRGFVWVTAGYALQTNASTRTRTTPTYGAPGSHTIAFGAEGQFNATTFTIGYARTMTGTNRVGGSPIVLVNPFDGGTAVVGNGTYDQSHDAFGINLELEF